MIVPVPAHAHIEHACVLSSLADEKLQEDMVCLPQHYAAGERGIIPQQALPRPQCGQHNAHRIYTTHT